MKKIICFAVLVLLSSGAYAVNYSDVKITGIGMAPSDDRIRFTIDKDPNVIFLTDLYSGEQLKRLIALVMTAYTTQSTVTFIQSSEASSSSPRHYTNVVSISMGSYTFD